MLTLRDLLRDLDVSPAAGAEGLDAAVRWVHISELEDPTPWLSGGELLLTTGMQLPGDDQQREYVGRLAGHGLAGLGLGTGFAHDALPEALVEAAEELGFPLFEVPYELPFIALTEKAFTAWSTSSTRVLRRALAAHERLERIVLSEQGLDGVAGALASLIGGPAIVFDGARRAARAARGGAPGGGRRARRRAARPVRAGARRGFAPGGELEGRALALPVARATGGRRRAPPQAWLVAAKDSGQLSEFDRLTLHQAVTIVALELLRRRMAEDTERRLAGDVLTALVSGELAGPELERRLEPFGLRERAGMLVLAPPRSVKGAVEDALARAVRDELPAGLVAGTGRFTCALVGLPPRRRRRRGAVRGRGAPARARGARGRDAARGAARAAPSRPATRGAPSTRRAARSRRARWPARTAPRAAGRWRPTTTSAPSSCCCRCRTTRRCACSATRSSRRSRTARAPTAAS